MEEIAGQVIGRKELPYVEMRCNKIRQHSKISDKEAQSTSSFQDQFKDVYSNVGNDEHLYCRGPRHAGPRIKIISPESITHKCLPGALKLKAPRFTMA